MSRCIYCEIVVKFAPSYFLGPVDVICLSLQWALFTTVHDSLWKSPSGLSLGNSIWSSKHVFTVKCVNIGCSGYLYLVRTIELGNFSNKITKLAIKHCTCIHCVPWFHWVMMFEAGVCRAQMICSTSISSNLFFSY